MDSDPRRRVELLVTVWASEMFRALVLDQRVFVCKVSIAVPVIYKHYIKHRIMVTLVG